MKTTPTLDDIFDLAEQIGIPLPEWLRTGNDWSAALHELSHWAVKPDGYIQIYLDKIKSYDSFLPLNSVPDAESVFQWDQRPTVRWPDGTEQQLDLNHIFAYQLDPTPNEYGARAWGLQVLDYMDWRNPLDCEELKDKYKNGVGTAQFDPQHLISDEWHTISAFGPDQLTFMDMDIPNGILRPQVDVAFDNQRIQVVRDGTIIWQKDILEGGEIVAWESSSQAPRFITLADIDALCEMA